MSPGSIDHYILVGPQISIKGNAVPEGAVADTYGTKLDGMRVRGGFASTILGFNILKQITPDLKLTIRQQIWAGIQNVQNASGIRQYNDSAAVDWREQWMQLEGSWGVAWGGRRIGLYNRGGMKMNWLLDAQPRRRAPVRCRLFRLGNLRSYRHRFHVSRPSRATRIRHARDGRTSVELCGARSRDDRRLRTPTGTARRSRDSRPSSRSTRTLQKRTRSTCGRMV